MIRPIAMRPRAAKPPSEEGMALVIVLIGLALLLTMAGQFASAMRLEGTTTLNFRATLTAGYLAEAAYHRALAEIVPQFDVVLLDLEETLVFRRPNEPSPKAPERQRIKLGPGHFSYRITDERARINLNGSQASREILQRLLTEIGVDRAARDVILDSILDWKDANEEYRLNGAESEYYLALPVPYRSKNGNFDSVAELGQVKGITPAILHGRPESPGLAEYVTAIPAATAGAAGSAPAGRGSNDINVNTASPIVLRAIYGFAPPEVDRLVAGRPYLSPNAVAATNLQRPNMQVGSDIFRIEATGEVPGQGRRTLVAVVQRKPGTDGVVRVTPLSFAWRVEGEAQ
jgi:general secretion pathway protein K